MTVLAMVLGGASGAAVGRLGGAVLSRLRRGVRPPPWSCETTVAVLWALVAARTAAGALPVWWAPVPLLLAWGGVLLVACDLLASRLPDALTLPAYPALFAAIGVASCASGSPVSIGAALLGAGLFAGVYLLVRLIAPASLGPGDVKLSGALGAAVGGRVGVAHQARLCPEPDITARSTTWCSLPRRVVVLGGMPRTETKRTPRCREVRSSRRRVR